MENFFFENFFQKGFTGADAFLRFLFWGNHV